MYGLPKIHKKDVPSRPILSMTRSAQHQLTKWLTSFLQPVLQNLFSNCVSDSFTFVKEVRQFTFSPSSVFLCSFDISSLFTNVLLAETLQICADALYNDDSMATSFPPNIFVELMQLATSSEEDCNTFLNHLNSLHFSLRFTYEKKSNHSLPFFDVLVERHDSEFLTSVYRKPTFTGQYLRWNSFSPQKRKVNLIGTLVHRAFMICSKTKLDPELGKIRSILLENGYPEHTTNSAFKQKL